MNFWAITRQQEEDLEMKLTCRETMITNLSRNDCALGGVPRHLSSEDTMLSKDRPSQCTLKELHDELEKSKVSTTTVEGLRSYLDPQVEEKTIVREDGDDEIIPKLLSLASEVLVLKGDLWTKEIPKDIITSIQTNLEIISLIDDLPPTPARNPEDTFLLRLLAYSNARDPWMTSASFSSAKRLLDKHTVRLTSPDFLVDRILKETIRPLFSTSRPVTITPAARKALNPQITRRPDEPSDIDPSNKPWKFAWPATMSLFRWAIEHADVSIPFFTHILISLASFFSAQISDN